MNAALSLTGRLIAFVTLMVVAVAFGLGLSIAVTASVLVAAVRSAGWERTLIFATAVAIAALLYVVLIP